MPGLYAGAETPAESAEGAMRIWRDDGGLCVRSETRGGVLFFFVRPMWKWPSFSRDSDGTFFLFVGPLRLIRRVG